MQYTDPSLPCNLDKSDTASVTESSSRLTADNLKTQRENLLKRIEKSMVQSDSGGFTTWSKLQKRSSENQLRRHPSGNNNCSSEHNRSLGDIDNVMKSQSMPNLYKQKVRTLLASNWSKGHNLCSSLVSVFCVLAFMFLF